MATNLFGRMREARRTRVDEAADRAVERARSRREDSDEVEAETAAREERLSERFAAQWHEMREARRVEEPAIEGGTSNFSRPPDASSTRLVHGSIALLGIVACAGSI